jgi:hypothetical protein
VRAIHHKKEASGVTMAQHDHTIMLADEFAHILMPGVGCHRGWRKASVDRREEIRAAVVMMEHEGFEIHGLIRGYLIKTRLFNDDQA